MSATKMATAARVERAGLKRALKAGEIELRAALDSGVAQRMTIGEVLGALPYSTRARRQTRSVHNATHGARRVCELAGLSADVKVCFLLAVERNRVSLAYGAYRQGS